MFFRLVVFIAALAGVGKLWYWARDGFDIRRVGNCIEASSEEIPSEILPILNQPFDYLGRGRQSFVFESRDGKYVLKLPRMDRYRTKLWIRSLPFMRKAAQASRERKAMQQAFAFNSFQIAYRELKEETALLYVHLQSTEGVPNIEIADRIGRRFEICLDNTVFLLQKKVSMAFPLLQERLKWKDFEGAKELVDQFLKLTLVRAEKGIFSQDSSFLTNFGYDGEKFLQIDVGSFHYKPQYQGEGAFIPCFFEALSQMRARIDPEMLQWLEMRANEILAERCDI